MTAKDLGLVGSVKNISSLVAPLVVIGISVGVFLTAHFLLVSWAETSELAHSVQHVMIFAAGAGVGSSVLQLLRASKTSRS